MLEWFFADTDSGQSPQELQSPGLGLCLLLPPVPSSEVGAFPASTASVWPKEDLGVGYPRASSLDVEVLPIQLQLGADSFHPFNSEPHTDWPAFVKLTSWSFFTL